MALGDTLSDTAISIREHLTEGANAVPYEGAFRSEVETLIEAIDALREKVDAESWGDPVLFARCLMNRGVDAALALATEVYGLSDEDALAVASAVGYSERG